MDAYLLPTMNFIVSFIEACGAVIIIIGVIRAMVEYIRLCFRRYDTIDVAGLRIRLGQSMVIALEFQVAADILKTGISPSWEDILILATIIALRTILNYLLERELTTLAPSSVLDDECDDRWIEEDSR